MIHFALRDAYKARENKRSIMLEIHDESFSMLRRQFSMFSQLCKVILVAW